MSRFALKTMKKVIRDMPVTVQELTQAKRAEFTKAVTEDRFRGPALLVSLGLVDPTLTEAEAADESADVIQEIVDLVMDISGMNTKEDSPEKKPDAG